MNRKTKITLYILIGIAAAFFAFLLANKGDGPIMGGFLSGSAASNIEDMEHLTKLNVQDAAASGQFILFEKKFNRFAAVKLADIPQNKDLYANIHFVEVNKGMKITAEWLLDGKSVKSETKAVPSEQKGVIAYLLEGSKIKKGSYKLQLYYRDKILFEQSFEVQ